MFSNRWRFHVPWALMVALLLGAGAMVPAQDPPDDGGRIIQLGPDRDARATTPDLGGDRRIYAPGFPEQPPQQASPYWIGIVGGPVSPEIRHHVDLAVGKGLQVIEVVPDSPAAEAGLQVHDVMIRANDVELDEMADLIELVRSEGEKQGQIAIEIIRHGQTETVWVKPVDRPARSPRQPLDPSAGGFGWQGDDPSDFFSGLFGGGPQGGPGLNFRSFGPGVVVGGQQMNFTQLPDGTSVKIEKRSDQPTRITVERDGDVWEIEGEDPESLEQLPEDLRPYVQQMLGQGAAPRAWGQGLNMEEFRRQMPQLGRDGDLQERLRQMEEQMRQLQERFLGPPQQQQPAEDQVR